jgi:hypothetical protein
MRKLNIEYQHQFIHNQIPNLITIDKISKLMTLLGIIKRRDVIGREIHTLFVIVRFHNRLDLKHEPFKVDGLDLVSESRLVLFLL